MDKNHQTSEFTSFQQERAKLLRLATTILKDIHDAEDVIQEASVKVWRYAGQLQDMDSVRAWLYKVVVNTCRDFLRRKKRETKNILSSPDAGITTDEYTVEFEEMISPLTDRQREIVLLRFGAGLTFKEIAVISELTESTVKYQLVKAIDKLKYFYNQPEEEV